MSLALFGELFKTFREGSEERAETLIVLCMLTLVLLSGVAVVWVLLLLKRVVRAGSETA